MNKHVILLSAATVLLFSCTRESDLIIQPVETITFTASWAGSDETRTILQSDGTSVWWESGAQINVFFSDKASGKFTSTNSQPQAIVDFQGSLPIIVGSVETENPAHSYLAVYPYNAANTCDGESVTLTVPSTQTAVEGTFANKMFPSIATSTNFHLAFYNICGGVRFTVANEGISSITFKANNEESLVGKVQVGFDGIPVVQDVIEGGSEVVINAPSGGFVPGKYYFAALLPQTLSKGVSLIFKKEDGKVASTSLDNSITINRSRFGKMEEKDKGLEFKDDGSGHEPTDVIAFADPAAKYACVAKFDINGDGEVSYEEAEAATSFDGLFDNWKGVTSFDEIRYFKNVQSLSEVFFDCNKLVSITVPENIIDLGTSAFAGCYRLSSVVLPSGITTIGNYTFQNCSSLSSIDIPENVSAVGLNAFCGCSSLTAIELPSGVTAIDDGTFANCSSLATIGLPSNVTSIGESAFYGCSSLSSIVLPPRLKTIGQYAFSGCSSLIQVVIPEGVTSIPQFCFQNCRSLVSISIPEGVTSIEYMAFNGVNMWKLELPSSISSLGSNCFGGITCIILPSTSPVTIQANTFDGVMGIFVPSNLIDMYTGMTTWANYASRLHPIDTYKEKNEFTLATSGAVDMGTSVKWAAYNLGATNLEESGEWYAWGETTKKSGYSYRWSNYLWCDGRSDSLTKYCNNPSYGNNGFTDNKTVLDLEDDAARANWGGTWRIPTDEEWTELMEKCLWAWTEYEGIQRLEVFCVESGMKICLHSHGYCFNGLLYGGPGYGCYWSSSLYKSSSDLAWSVSFSIEKSVSREYVSRAQGRSIRPVCD